MTKQFVALVPMKGHSERVPNKNLKDFNGRPLFHCVVDALLKSKNVSQVVINTDSEEIAKSALDNFDRVTIVNRPEEIQGDFVSMNKVIEHDLSQVDGDYFLQTHSTNPLLTAETIDKAIEAFHNLDSNFDSLFSVTRHQARFFDKDEIPVNHNPDELLRTQDLPPLYEENSNIYLFSRDSFQKTNARIGAHPKIFEMDKIEAIDIDEPEDFIIAESLYKALRMKKD